ncbi:PREDICTED: uncharacterized protein LOC109149793 [Ipomoea nil]|uniref:uncharacterized protein LOC109149793 n=1 Tax=Ipomoea nil TaxID=35883 RepID=UPI000901BF00|nr:PREDICTED: uncharacterized protein LOC109149793 [Ipomoea nil]
MEQFYTLRAEFLVVGFLLFSVSVHAQISIPSKQDGFWYKDRAAGIDSILIEAFLDPVCPDSRDAWPPLKQAFEHYGSRVSLVVYPFALPYHDNAFLCSRALHIVNKFNSSSPYKLLESFFGSQKEFYNKATFNLSRASVVAYVARFAANTVGNTLYDEIKAGFSDSTTDHATRYSFKYGCLKGVYGTPFFFVNGFPLPDAGSALAYEDWRSIIDPLVAEAETRRVQPSHLLL